MEYQKPDSLLKSGWVYLGHLKGQSPLTPSISVTIGRFPRARLKVRKMQFNLSLFLFTALQRGPGQYRYFNIIT